MKRSGAFRHAVLGVLCSLTMVVSGLAPMAVQAQATSITINGTALALDGTKVSCGAGYAWYDAGNNQLVLDHATINSDGTKHGIEIQGDAIGVRLKLIGDNTITVAHNLGGYDGIYTKAPLATCGNGTLMIEAGDRYGIYVNNADLVISNPLTITGCNDRYPSNGIACWGNVSFQNTTADITGSNYGVRVIGGNLSVAESDVTITGTTDGQAVLINGDSKSLKVDGASKVKVIGGVGGSSGIIDITPAADGSVEATIGTSRDGSDATTNSYNSYQSLSSLTTYKYIYLVGSKFVTPVPKGDDTTETSTWTAGHHCNHVYEWETYQQATATNDGIMRYRCKYCGDVQYQVPVTAYYMFNKNTQEAILKAEQGATVTTETALFISFHDMVQKALEQRPDVTLVVDYRNAGKNYEMTIPAGSAEQLDALFGDSQFAGFLYLGGTYATTELPEDWTFSTVPASVVWFGTTNAH